MNTYAQMKKLEYEAETLVELATVPGTSLVERAMVLQAAAAVLSAELLREIQGTLSDLSELTEIRHGLVNGLDAVKEQIRDASRDQWAALDEISRTLRDR